MGRKLRGRCALLLMLGLLGCQTSPIQNALPCPDAATEAQKLALSDYDSRLCDAVGKRWLQLLDQQKAPQNRDRVVVQFELYKDGHVAETRVIENTEGQVFGLLCHRAITGPAPYEAWPDELCLLFPNPRRFRFSFEFDTRGKDRTAAVEVRNRPTAPLVRDSETFIAMYLPEERHHGPLRAKEFFPPEQNIDGSLLDSAPYIPYQEVRWEWHP